MRGETCHPSGIAIHTVGVLLLRISKYFGFFKSISVYNPPVHSPDILRHPTDTP